MPFISRQQVMDSGWGKGVSSPRRVLLSGPESQGLWMWTMAKEKSVGWELWESREASQREQWVHVTAGLIREECHIGKVCFWCACAAHYQRNNVVKLPSADVQGPLLQDLAQDCSLKAVLLTSFIKLSPGPYYPMSSTIQVQQNYLRYLFKMQNTLSSPNKSEILV